MSRWLRTITPDATLQVMGRDKIASWLFSVFLALGPVYWLPGVSMESLRSFEWGLFLVTIVLVFGVELWKGRLPFPPGLLGPLGFAGLLVLWIPGLVQANAMSAVIELVLKVGISSMFFWCFFCLSRDGVDVLAIFRRAFAFVVLLACIALVISVLETQYKICSWKAASAAGFGLKPTGWSIGLAFFVPVAALVSLTLHNRRLWQFVSGAGLFALISSQFVSGGRAGLLVSFVCIAAFALRHSLRWLAVGTVGIGFVVSLFYLADQERCFLHLKLDRVARLDLSVLQRGTVNLAALPQSLLDNLTTRRIQGYRLGLKKIWERPFLGHGLRRVLYDTPVGSQTEIHNLWIKWAAYTGLLAPLVFLGMVGLILWTGVWLCRDPERSPAERDHAVLLTLILIVGLIIAMGEVNIPLGAFQISSPWWAAAGALVGTASRCFTSPLGVSSPLPPPPRIW